MFNNEKQIPKNKKIEKTITKQIRVEEVEPDRKCSKDMVYVVTLSENEVYAIKNILNVTDSKIIV